MRSSQMAKARRGMRESEMALHKSGVSSRAAPAAQTARNALAPIGNAGGAALAGAGMDATNGIGSAKASGKDSWIAGIPFVGRGERTSAAVRVVSQCAHTGSACQPGSSMDPAGSASAHASAASHTRCRADAVAWLIARTTTPATARSTKLFTATPESSASEAALTGPPFSHGRSGPASVSVVHP